MIKTNVAFLDGRLLSSQSEQFGKFSKSSDWLEKSRPSKKALLFWSCKQAKCDLWKKGNLFIFRFARIFSNLPDNFQAGKGYVPPCLFLLRLCIYINFWSKIFFAKRQKKILGADKFQSFLSTSCIKRDTIQFGRVWKILGLKQMCVGFPKPNWGVYSEPRPLARLRITFHSRLIKHSLEIFWICNIDSKLFSVSLKALPPIIIMHDMFLHCANQSKSLVSRF